MTYLQSIILGLVQGIAEFIPVSSSGHLVVLRNIMELSEIPVLFDILLHVSTLAVIIIIFRRKIGEIILSLSRGVKGKREEGDSEKRVHRNLPG